MMNLIPIVSLLNYVFQGLVHSILSPVFLVVLFIIYTQNKKTLGMEYRILGRCRVTIARQMMVDLLYGIVAGFIGSVLVVILGISIETTGFLYIWPLAILLMLINPRYICFSYAGGLLSLCYLIFGVPKIDVPGLIALIGVLHLMESLLILMSGHSNSLPIIVDNEVYGHVGAFTMRRFWPIPIIILMMAAKDMAGGDLLKMPDWWPLIRPDNLVDGPNTVFLMVSVVAALGYGDMAVTQVPRERCRRSSILLCIYSIVLILAAYLAVRDAGFKWVAAVLAPVAHEFLILHGIRTEQRGQPLFYPVDEGLRVLDTMPGSVAEKMGIGQGDIILAINGKKVSSINMMNNILQDFPTYIWIDAVDVKGRRKTYDIKRYPNGINSLGAFIVPKNGVKTVKMKQPVSPFFRIIKRITGKRSH
jgi:hypothetical protein